MLLCVIHLEHIVISTSSDGNKEDTQSNSEATRIDRRHRQFQCYAHERDDHHHLNTFIKVKERINDKHVYAKNKAFKKCTLIEGEWHWQRNEMQNWSSALLHTITILLQTKCLAFFARIFGLLSRAVSQLPTHTHTADIMTFHNILFAPLVMRLAWL